MPQHSDQPPIDAIILFSHGSLLCGAGETLRRLADYMRDRGDAQLVEVGYLNYSQPSFEVAFERCVNAGASCITVAPYFLVAGKFVQVDLPPKIEAMRRKYPHIEVRMAQAMRYHTGLADAILSCAERAMPPARWRDHLKTAPQYCRIDPQCPLFGSDFCPVSSGGGSENGEDVSCHQGIPLPLVQVAEAGRAHD